MHVKNYRVNIVDFSVIILIIKYINEINKYFLSHTT